MHPVQHQVVHQLRRRRARGAVAGPVGDRDGSEAGERRRADRRDPAARLPRSGTHGPPQALQVGGGLVQLLADRRGHLHLDLEQLVLGFVGSQSRQQFGGGQDLGGPGDRDPAHGIDQQVLFLDSEGQHGARLPHITVGNPAVRREARPVVRLR